MARNPRHVARCLFSFPRRPARRFSDPHRAVSAPRLLRRHRFHCSTLLLLSHLSNTDTLTCIFFCVALVTKTHPPRKHYITESKPLPKAEPTLAYGEVHKTVLLLSSFFLLSQCVPLLIMLSVKVYGEK